MFPEDNTCRCDDIGAAEFSTYDVILDTRTAEEFADDHVPGSIHAETFTPSEAQLAIADIHNASEEDLDVANNLAAQNIKRFLDTLGDEVQGSRALVYCSTGDGRSSAWVTAMQERGFTAHKIPGGYASYRSWVRSSLQHLARMFCFHVICGLHGYDNGEVIHHINNAGGQAIDLIGLANAYAGVQVNGSRMLFESHLLEQLRHKDIDSPVWADYTAILHYSSILPKALRKALEEPARLCLISTPMDERIKLWSRHHSDILRQEPQAIVDELLIKYRGIDNALVVELRDLARQSNTDEILSRLMLNHFDHQYGASISRIQDHLTSVMNISLQETNETSMLQLARDLVELTSSK